MHRPLLRLGGAVAAATALLTASGGGSDDEAAADETATSADDGWSYTDRSGRGVRLDEQPSRIVAHASAAALMSFGIEPIAIYADAPVEDDLALDGLDLDGSEIVGEEWGVINVEAVAALDPT